MGPSSFHHPIHAHAIVFVHSPQIKPGVGVAVGPPRQVTAVLAYRPTSSPCPWRWGFCLPGPQQPRKPVALIMGYFPSFSLSIIYGLLWDMVAHYFGLLGVPGNLEHMLFTKMSWRLVFHFGVWSTYKRTYSNLHFGKFKRALLRGP